MFRAIGFVIGIVAIRVFMPDVFHGFERALLAFFQSAERIFAYVPTDASHLASINLIPQPDPANFPRWSR
jgi:hypothetical protein